MPYQFKWTYKPQGRRKRITKRFHAKMHCAKCKAKTGANQRGPNCKRDVCVGLPYCTQHLPTRMFLKKIKNGLKAFHPQLEKVQKLSKKPVAELKNGGVIFKRGEQICRLDGEPLSFNAMQHRYGAYSGRIRDSPYAYKFPEESGTEHRAIYEDAGLKRGLAALMKQHRTNFNAKLVARYYAKRKYPYHMVEATEDIKHNDEIVIEEVKKDDFWTIGEIKHRTYTSKKLPAKGVTYNQGAYMKKRNATWDYQMDPPVVKADTARIRRDYDNLVKEWKQQNRGAAPRRRQTGRRKTGRKKKKKASKKKKPRKGVSYGGRVIHETSPPAQGSRTPPKSKSSDLPANIPSTYKENWQFDSLSRSKSPKPKRPKKTKQKKSPEPPTYEENWEIDAAPRISGSKTPSVLGSKTPSIFGSKTPSRTPSKFESKTPTKEKPKKKKAVQFVPRQVRMKKKKAPIQKSKSVEKAISKVKKTKEQQKKATTKAPAKKKRAPVRRGPGGEPISASRSRVLPVERIDLLPHLRFDKEGRVTDGHYADTENGRKLFDEAMKWVNKKPVIRGRRIKRDANNRLVLRPNAPKRNIPFDMFVTVRMQPVGSGGSARSESKSKSSSSRLILSADAQKRVDPKRAKATADKAKRDALIKKRQDEIRRLEADLVAKKAQKEAEKGPKKRAIIIYFATRASTKGLRTPRDQEMFKKGDLKSDELKKQFWGDKKLVAAGIVTRAEPAQNYIDTTQNEHHQKWYNGLTTEKKKTYGYAWIIDEWKELSKMHDNPGGQSNIMPVPKTILDKIHAENDFLNGWFKKYNVVKEYRLVVDSRWIRMMKLGTKKYELRRNPPAALREPKKKKKRGKTTKKKKASGRGKTTKKKKASGPPPPLQELSPPPKATKKKIKGRKRNLATKLQQLQKKKQTVVQQQPPPIITGPRKRRGPRKRQKLKAPAKSVVDELVNSMQKMNIRGLSPSRSPSAPPLNEISSSSGESSKSSLMPAGSAKIAKKTNVCSENNLEACGRSKLKLMCVQRGIDTEMFKSQGKPTLIRLLKMDRNRFTWKPLIPAESRPKAILRKSELTPENLCEKLATHSTQDYVAKRKSIKLNLDPKSQINYKNFAKLINANFFNKMLELYDKVFFGSVIASVVNQRLVRFNIWWSEGDNQYQIVWNEKTKKGVLSKTWNRIIKQKELRKLMTGRILKALNINLNQKTFFDSMREARKITNWNKLGRPVVAYGVICRDVLDCIMLAFEHQFIIAMMQVFCPKLARPGSTVGSWKGKTTQSFNKTFMSIVCNTFGHTTHKQRIKYPIHSLHTKRDFPVNTGAYILSNPYDAKSKKITGVIEKAETNNAVFTSNNGIKYNVPYQMLFLSAGTPPVGRSPEKLKSDAPGFKVDAVTSVRPECRKKLDICTIDELRALTRKLKLGTMGTKQQLIKRIRDRDTSTKKCSQARLTASNCTTNQLLKIIKTRKLTFPKKIKDNKTGLIKLINDDRKRRMENVSETKRSKFENEDFSIGETIEFYLRPENKTIKRRHRAIIMGKTTNRAKVILESEPNIDYHLPYGLMFKLKGKLQP